MFIRNLIMALFFICFFGLSLLPVACRPLYPNPARILAASVGRLAASGSVWGRVWHACASVAACTTVAMRFLLITHVDVQIR